MTLTQDKRRAAVTLQAEAAANGHKITLATAAEAIDSLRFIGRSLHAIYERQCNGHSTGAPLWQEDVPARERDERREAKLEARAIAILSQWGIEPDFCSDPRGGPLRIKTPVTGLNDGWDGRQNPVWYVPCYSGR